MDGAITQTVGPVKVPPNSWMDINLTETVVSTQDSHTVEAECKRASNPNMTGAVLYADDVHNYYRQTSGGGDGSGGGTPPQ